MPTLKDFKAGQSAYTLEYPVKLHIDPSVSDPNQEYSEYIHEYVVKTTGRKFITLSDGRKFQESTGRQKLDHLIQTEPSRFCYMRDKMLFTSRQDAIRHMQKRNTIQHIQENINRIPWAALNLKTLTDIENLIMQAIESENQERT